MSVFQVNGFVEVPVTIRIEAGNAADAIALAADAWSGLTDFCNDLVGVDGDGESYALVEAGCMSPTWSDAELIDNPSEDSYVPKEETVGE